MRTSTAHCYVGVGGGGGFVLRGNKKRIRMSSDEQRRLQLLEIYGAQRLAFFVPLQLSRHITYLCCNVPTYCINLMLPLVVILEEDVRMPPAFVANTKFSSCKTQYCGAARETPR